MYQGYEALSRERIREMRAAAAEVRLARAMASAQRWSWLARYAERRAARAHRAVAVSAVDSYSLAG
jgi:hypothetical protein